MAPMHQDQKNSAAARTTAATRATHATHAPKAISLGLQGGGSHGAFTWGVLDRLLADPRIELDGISGTSAGAVNAVALAHGFATAQAKGVDARTGSRQALARVWNGVVALGGIQAGRIGFTDWFGVVPLFQQAFSNLVSPYQLNPLDISPLRELIRREIDFGAIARLAAPKVFVCATHITSGDPEIFSGQRLNLAAVMASATLPMLAQAVEIDGDHYWDGGFSGNPSLSPLIDECDSRDLLLVQLDPLRRREVPRTANDIADRVNELTFNASLVAQLRTIDFINRLLAKGSVDAALYKTLHMHRIDGGEALDKYGASSKLSVDAELIRELFDLGSAAADAWLKKNFDKIGKQGTLDFDRELGPALRLSC